MGVLMRSALRPREPSRQLVAPLTICRFRSWSSDVASLLRGFAKSAAPALLVTAAVLLVVEHWEHFRASDIALLVLIVAAVAIQILNHRAKRITPQDSGK